MISPIIAVTTSNPVATVAQNTEAQGVLNSQTATNQIKKEERQTRETVVKKDESVFYQREHDAKEEGRNKYANLYNNKRKRVLEEPEEKTVTRENFDIMI